MKVVVGQGSCGIATGAKKTAAELEKQIAERGLDVKVDITGCVGTCYLEPIVDVYDDNGEMTRYVKVQPDKVEKIVEDHLVNHKVVEEQSISSEDEQFVAKQQRVVLRNCGIINPENIDEYIEADGSVSVGDYDLVPLLDTFIREHPDFSWHGRKGILAMTGYNGVLGYRTDIAYKTGENLQDDQKKFLEDNPDFDYDQDVADATKVADAMKAEGWEFASHTWGHMNATERSAEDLKTDDQKWKSYVAPILGDTDMIIFAFGADIGDWSGYSSDNPKFQYYKSAGYDYFCNVDSSQYFVQITDQYFRQGRRNLDGYRMYYNPEMLSDLFDVADVWDSSRPTPVPQM